MERSSAPEGWVDDVVLPTDDFGEQKCYSGPIDEPTMASCIKCKHSTFALADSCDFLCKACESESGPSCSVVANHDGAVFGLRRAIVYPNI